MRQKSISPSVLICLLVVLVFAVYTSPVRAATTTWTGSVNGDWFTDHNWTNYVPTSSTDAYFNNGGKAQISTNSSATARSLTLGLNLGDSGAVDVYGPNASLVVADSLNIPGDIYVGYRDRGTLTISGGGMVTSGNGNIAALAGMLWVSNGAVTVTGANSTWMINGRLWIGGGSGGSGGTGLLSVFNGGTVVVQPPSHAGNIIIWPSGTLTGNGTVVGDSPLFQTTIQGTIAPTGGTLTIYSDLTFTSVTPGSAPTMECTVTAQDVPTTPKVSVSGAATLTGRISVTMTGDFSFAPTRYTLLRATNGVSGSFSVVSIKYPTGETWAPRITYDANNVYLDRIFNSNP